LGRRPAGSCGTVSLSARVRGDVLAMLFEISDGQYLPVDVRGEDFGPIRRPHHHVRRRNDTNA
jgi:hypothetical protein